MSVSAISSNQQVSPLDPSSTLPPSLQAVASNYNALGTALNAGDLASAQQAFAQLVQSVPAGAAPSDGASSSSSPSDGSVGGDIVSLGQALQSGDLGTAQQAFAKLQQAVQLADPSGAGKARGHRHHGGGGGGGGGAADALAALTDPTSGSSSAITDQTTVTNPDGTQTVTTTYGDGTKATTIQPAPTVAGTTLDPTNAGQGATLLQAQEQANKAI